MRRVVRIPPSPLDTFLTGVRYLSSKPQICLTAYGPHAVITERVRDYAVCRSAAIISFSTQKATRAIPILKRKK